MMDKITQQNLVEFTLDKAAHSHFITLYPHAENQRTVFK